MSNCKWEPPVATLLALLLTAGCGAPPSIPLLAGRGSSGTDYIIFEIQEVTILADKRDGFDGQTEFQLYVIASDGTTSAKQTYPADSFVAVSPGDTIPLDKFGLWVDANAIGDELVIYILAVDLDDQAPMGELTNSVVAGLLETAVTAVLTQGAGLTVELAVGILADQGGGLLQEWLEEADPIGEATITLKRSKGWGAGRPVTLRTADGGLEIVYQVHLEGVDGSLDQESDILALVSEEGGPPGCVRVASPSVNMRIGPGKDFEDVGFLREGAVVEVFERKNQQWLHIRPPEDYRCYEELWIWEGATQPASC